MSIDHGLIEALTKYLDRPKLKLAPLKWDGSDRTYYRISAPDEEPSQVLMLLGDSDRQKLRENRYDWVHIQKDLADSQFRVPAIQGILPEKGALIIEDLGNTSLQALHEAKDKNATELYRQSFKMLGGLIQLNPQGTIWSQRAFDLDKLHSELMFLNQHLLEPFNLVSSQEKELFIQETKNLAESISHSSKYFCHRDFHSRNLMVLPNGSLGIIDFQDARLGPATYDLVSLVFDSYVDLSKEIRLGFIKEAINILSKGAPNEDLESQWPLVLLQR